MNFAVAADLDLFVMGAARPGGRTLHNRSHKFRPPPYRRDSLMATRRGEKFSLEQMTQKNRQLSRFLSYRVFAGYVERLTVTVGKGVNLIATSSVAFSLSRAMLRTPVRPGLSSRILEQHKNLAEWRHENFAINRC